MYKEMKESVFQEYKYLDKVSNEDMNERLEIHNWYKYGIIEASAKGFTSKVNSKINQSMFNSVDDVLDCFTSYMNKAKLEKYTI